MPNPEGSNQFAPSRPQGAAKKLSTLSKAAPMSGAKVPSVEGAPKQAQRRAVKGARAAPLEPEASPPPLPAPSYNAQLAAVWQELLAAAPGDELIAYYAQKSLRAP